MRDAAGARRILALESDVAAYRSGSEGIRSAPLELAPGDPVRLSVLGDRVLAVVSELGSPGAGGAEAPRRGAWDRFRSDAEIARLVAARYPGLGFRGLAVLERGVSGRVSRLRLDGKDGRSTQVEGLAVRWTLDLPDTWFDTSRIDDGSRHGWRFRGRGWGHGVGLCQIGAVGMGFRGLDYRLILRHYYGGAAVVALPVAGGGSGLGVSSP